MAKEDVLAALSPLYGLAKGKGPYANKWLMGKLGRDRKEYVELEEEEASRLAAEEADRLRMEGLLAESSQGLKAGGVVRKSGRSRGDGKARRGRTRGRII